MIAGCGGSGSSTLPAMGGSSEVMPSSAAAGTAAALPSSTTAASGSAASGAVGTANTASTLRTALSAAPATATGAYASGVLSDGPLAYYQLSDSDATLGDAGPHGLSGTYGSSVRRRVDAITDGASAAAQFPGGGGYNSNGFAYTRPNGAFQPWRITLEAWVSLNAPNSTNHDIPFVSYGTMAHGVRYGLFLHPLGSGAQSVLYEQRNSTGNGLTLYGNTRLAVGQAYHIVESSDGSTVKLYVNGVLDSSASYSGAIDYASSLVANGFEIGGADQIPAYATASFPGTIAQVAAYGNPLSAAQVTSHFLAGQILPMVTETPSDSDAFVDSIGINAHFDNPYSEYATRFPQVRSMLVASGIRHIREAMSFDDADYLTMMKDLAASGIYGSYMTQMNLSENQVRSFPAMVGASFEQFEPPNEQDDVGNADWLPECRSYQQKLYSWVKQDSQISKYPVLAPSIVKIQDIVALGNMSSELDAGNIHDYFAVFNPGTIGWGSYFAPYGNYGSITYNRNLGKVIAGDSKPIEATETGYGTVAGNPLTLDYRADLRYMTRMFFEQYNNGIARTYSYELLDGGGTPAFSNFGIIQTDLNPKPAYTGIKSIIGQLNDKGSRFTTTPLTYRLTGFVNNVHHTLLQKRNGSYVLALWLEVPDWVTLHNAGGDIEVPSQSVTLDTTKHFASASIAAMDDNGNMSTSALSWSGQSANVTVTDKVSLITLTP